VDGNGGVGGYKWLPVVSDYCTGCGRCVDACPHGCLGLVWEFATLQHPEACTSDGDCAAACTDDAIRMAWVASSADRAVGRWCDRPLADDASPPGLMGKLRGRLAWLHRLEGGR